MQREPYVDVVTSHLTFFFFNDTATTEIYTLSLHDALPICCIVTTGTFLRALMHTGERKTEGGRVGEAAAKGLSGCLAKLGLELGRLKTGTPPRLKKETIDFSRFEEQPGDDEPAPFSFLNEYAPVQARGLQSPLFD